MVIVQVLKIQHGSTAPKEVLLIHRNQKSFLLLIHNHHVKLCLRCHGQDAPRNHSCTPEATLTRWQHQFWPTSQGGSEVRSVSADYRLQGCHHPAHSPISQVKQCHVPHTKHTTGSQKVFLAVPLQTATAPAAALQTPKRHSHAWPPRHPLGLLSGSSATTLTNI